MVFRFFQNRDIWWHSSVRLGIFLANIRCTRDKWVYLDPNGLLNLITQLKQQQRYFGIEWILLLIFVNVSESCDLTWSCIDFFRFLKLFNNGYWGIKNSYYGDNGILKYKMRINWSSTLYISGTSILIIQPFRKVEEGCI